VPNEAKGVSARFVFVRPATAARASSEGWRLCLRPNSVRCHVGADKKTEAGLNVVVGKEVVDYFN
jgi:hypothetical protein